MAVPILKITNQYDIPINSLLIKDVTGLYDAADNPFGWGGVNTTKATITKATLTILRNQKNILTLDVTELIKASDPLVEEYLIHTEELEPIPDAVYIAKLTVEDLTSDSASDPTATFVVEYSKTIASKYWAHLALNHDIWKRSDFERECHWLEMSIRGLESLTRRGLEDRYLNLLDAVMLRIDNNKIEYNLNF